MDNKEKFRNDMKIIQESLRLTYGPYTKKEKIEMFISDLIWVLFPIIMLLGIISGVLTLISGLTKTI